ncbi:ATP-binding domain-containing protein [Caulobacter segnis]
MTGTPALTLVTLSEALALKGIATNNIMADPYNEPPFTLPGKVTLSTVYRAKGNEAAAIIAVGIDAITVATRAGRNKIFTAFTRSKAWLRVSGVSPRADPRFSLS